MVAWASQVHTGAFHHKGKKMDAEITKLFIIAYGGILVGLFGFVFLFAIFDPKN